VRRPPRQRRRYPAETLREAAQLPAIKELCKMYIVLGMTKKAAAGDQALAQTH